MNIRLLEKLKEADGRFVPLALLEGTGNVEKVRAQLQQLESFGFELEWHPYLGVAYRGFASRLCPDQIEWELRTHTIGRRLAVWNRVTSTNDLAGKAGESRANDGLVVLAEEQTAGRGRLGRPWTSPGGSGLLFSTLLFPPRKLEVAGWMTALGAVAVAEVVEEFCGVKAQIKWPNDVRVAGRKLAGVLVERRYGWVLGIGVNVNAEEADFPPELRETATSMRRLANHQPLDRSAVVRRLIQRLDAHYTRGFDQGVRPLEECWRNRLEWVGQRVRVESASGTLLGTLREVSFSGGLEIVLAGSGHDQNCWVAASEILTLTPVSEEASKV